MFLYSVDFDIMRSGLGSTTGAYSIIARATITESAIIEASQENWDTFIDFVFLRGISVYYFEVSQVFACCVLKKQFGDHTGRFPFLRLSPLLSALRLQCGSIAWTPPTALYRVSTVLRAYLLLYHIN